MPVQRSPVPTRRKVDAPPGTPATTSGASESSPAPPDRASGMDIDTKARKSVDLCATTGNKASEETVSTVSEVGNEDVECNEETPTVGKLDKDAYKPWGTCSRSSSDAGSEGTSVSGRGPAICNGGPGNMTCGTPVTDTDLGVQCDLCRDWFHTNCQSVSKYAYNALAKHDKTLSWLCFDCKRTLKPTKNKVCNCSNMEADWSSKLEKLGPMQDKIDSISDSLQKQEKLIIEHSQLLQKSQEEVRESKVSYAEVIKGSCAEVVEKVSTKLDTLPSPHR